MIIAMSLYLKDKGGEITEYEPVSKFGTALAKVLLDISEKLGNPDDLTTLAGWRLLDEIIKVWEKGFSDEARNWVIDREKDIEAERSMSQHVKGGGWTPVSYPLGLFRLVKLMLPKTKLNDRRVYSQLAQRYPKLFKVTNYNV